MVVRNYAGARRGAARQAVVAMDVAKVDATVQVILKKNDIPGHRDRGPGTSDLVRPCSGSRVAHEPLTGTSMRSHRALPCERLRFLVGSTCNKEVRYSFQRYLRNTRIPKDSHRSDSQVAGSWQAAATRPVRPLLATPTLCVPTGTFALCPHSSKPHPTPPSTRSVSSPPRRCSTVMTPPSTFPLRRDFAPSSLNMLGASTHH